MYDAGDSRHFFVNELCQLKNRNYIIPLRWVNVHKESKIIVHADAYAVNVINVSFPNLSLYHTDVCLDKGCFQC